MSKLLLFHYLRGALAFNQLTGINKYNHISQQFLLPSEHVGHHLMAKASSRIFSKFFSKLPAYLISLLHVRKNPTL